MLNYTDQINEQAHLEDCENQAEGLPCICLALLEERQDIEDEIRIERELEDRIFDMDNLIGEKI